MIQHASVISGYDDKEKTIFHYVPEQKPSEEGIQVGVIPEKDLKPFGLRMDA